MTIGEKIKKARIDAKMTQKELAEKCGMADSAIRKYESGKITPKVETIEKIADALGIPWLDLYPDSTAREAAMKSILAITDELQGQFEKMKAGFPSTDLKLATAEELEYRAILLKQFEKLNIKGQRVAVERVQELAQIPAYQRPAEPAGDGTQSADDKEPDKK